MSYNELEIDENLSLHRKMWVVQRIGWFAIAILIAGSLLGFFGLGGPYSQTEKKTVWGVLKYEKFLRWNGPVLIEIHPQNLASIVSREGVTIWISMDFAREIKFDAILPSPDSTAIGKDRIEYKFLFSKSSGLESFPIVIRGEAYEVGWHSGQIGIVGESENFEIGQFVYP